MRRLVVTFTVAALVGAVAWIPALMAEEGESVGMTLYNKKCAMCHGKDGVAKKLAKGSGNFNEPEWQKENTLEQVIKVVTEGKGKMRPYQEKLSTEQIKAVSAYIKAMGSSENLGGGLAAAE